MPRALVIRLALVLIVIVGTFVALARIDPTKAPTRVEKVIPDNALAK